MKRYILLFTCYLFTTNLSAQSIYFPPADGNEWETLALDSLNWCEERVDSLYEFLELQGTKSFILLKDGKIVLERYFGTFSQDSSWVWFSAGKSLRAVLIGIAQEEGLLNINDRISEYLGRGWTSLSQAREDSITIWHQLTMTSGLNELFFTCTNPECLRYVADAGTRWVYHNSPYNLLKDVLENASGENINQFTTSRVKEKISMRSGFWVNSGFNSFFFSRARDMARFGLLAQNKGWWGDTPILEDSVYAEQMIRTSQTLNPSYGYLWWLNGKDSYIPPGLPISQPGSIVPDAPSDVFFAAGAQGQYISISPGQGLVMVRQGLEVSGDLASLNLHNEIWKRVMNLSCSTVSQNPTLDNQISVYPNPASNILHVEGVKGGAFSVSVYDLSGKKQLSVFNEFQVNTQSLSPGLYFIRIIHTGGIFTESVEIK